LYIVNLSKVFVDWEFQTRNLNFCKPTIFNADMEYCVILLHEKIGNILTQFQQFLAYFACFMPRVMPNNKRDFI
jgi:hypothetical protein